MSILIRQALRNCPRFNQVCKISNDLVPGAVAPHWEMVVKKEEEEQKSLLVGRVFATNLKNAIEVQVKKMVLDKKIWMVSIFTIFKFII